MFYARVFTPEVVQYMRENAEGLWIKDLTNKINAHFGTSLKYGQIRSAMRNYKIKCGKVAKFEKGHTCWNKGKHTGGGPPHTLFQKGHVYKEPVPVGTKSARADGAWVKTAAPNVWRQLHRVVWEAANGPMPKGHAIVFGDGNNQNCELENLILVTRKQLIRMNNMGLERVNTETTKCVATIADISNKIGERKREGKRRRNGATQRTDNRHEERNL